MTSASKTANSSFLHITLCLLYIKMIVFSRDGWPAWSISDCAVDNWMDEEYISISIASFTWRRNLHHITSHYITLHHITSHYITFTHYITLHHMTSHHSHDITSHYITLHASFTWHHITSHYITLHHITSHYITLHHITSHDVHHSHDITLHYITIFVDAPLYHCAHQLFHNRRQQNSSGRDSQTSRHLFVLYR